MQKYLIVNADDFGLSSEINDGIIDTFQNGLVRSASLMTTEDGFADAIEKIKKPPLLDIGIHLNIVRGKPKRSLIYIFFRRIFNKRGLETEIRQEFERQIRTAIDQGVKITHLDTEKHLHAFPFILGIVIELAKKYEIKSIRFPFEEAVSLRKAGLRQALKILLSRLFIRRCSRLFDQSGIQRPDFFYGISLSNRFSVDNLKELVDNLKPGVSELSCHPSAKSGGETPSSFIKNESRDRERKTLTSPELLDYLKEKDITLTNFRIFE